MRQIQINALITFLNETNAGAFVGGHLANYYYYFFYVFKISMIFSTFGHEA